MLMIFLMIFSLGINSWGNVTVNVNEQGEVIYIYPERDHKNVEAALIELKEFRVEFPRLETSYEDALESRLYWKDLNNSKIKVIDNLKMQRNITVIGFVTSTVIAVLIGVFK